jgi:Protein of unknown function (DUF3108)
MNLMNLLNPIKKSAIFAICLTTMAFMPQQTPPQYNELPVAPLSNQTVENTAFQNGEELTYKIFYNLNFVWIPAGEVTFHVSDEGSRYHLSAEGKTYSSYEWFYKAYNKLDSYIDKSTFLPQTSIRLVAENRYKVYDKVQFDQKNRLANFERGDTKDEVKLRGSMKLEDAMHDMLSAVYYSRTIDYAQAKQGQDFPMKVFLDETTYSLKYRYMGTEEKNIRGLGKFSTLKLSPQLVAGNVFSESSQMKIWATNDANRLPLMIESPVSVGSVKVVLKSYKGLKHALSSKKE